MAPLPTTPFTIPGGCNCGALRYRISIPTASARPPHPKSPPPSSASASNSATIYLPIIFTDHCNDCRRAGGAIIPAWICQPLDWMEVELVPRPRGAPAPVEPSGQVANGPIGSSSSSSDNDVAKLVGSTAGDDERKASSSGESKKIVLTAAAALRGPSKSTQGTYLQFYESSPGAMRGFCARCGTHLSFTEPTDMPTLVDVVLGTVDREVLEEEYMVPERQLWWDLGIDWVKDLASGGGGWAEMVKHPRGDQQVYVP